MRLFSYIGQRSATFLIAGMLVAAFSPNVSAFMRPLLPFLVPLILALGFVQLDLKKSLTELFSPKRLALILGTVLAFMLLTTLILVILARAFHLTELSILLLVVFFAAPPLSSSVSMSLILGFNAHATLQVTLLSMLLTPFIGPLCFGVAGLDLDVNLVAMSLGMATMIAGGFLIAIVIQLLIGKDKISRNKTTFSGFSVIVMIIFIFPLFDGVAQYITLAPLQSLYFLLLALALNFGGHFFIRWLANFTSDKQTASALGFMFGNRNVSIYLAVLPINPALSVFVAAAQIPIYITPALLQQCNDNTDGER